MARVCTLKRMRRMALRAALRRPGPTANLLKRYRPVKLRPSDRGSEGQGPK